jgi:hypothetical protein
MKKPFEVQIQESNGFFSNPFRYKYFKTHQEAKDFMKKEKHKKSVVAMSIIKLPETSMDKQVKKQRSKYI